MEGENKNFDDYPVPDILKYATKALNYIYPSNIQKEYLNSLSNLNKNILITSKAGSGKTFTYLMGVLCNINLDVKTLQAVILLPTRELASQTSYYIDKINESKLLNEEITYNVLIGGQKECKLENNYMIIIGTLGRMRKLFKNNIKKFKNFVNVKMLVIDEADKMLSQNKNNNYDNFLKMFINKQNKVLKTILVTASFDDKAKLFYLNYLDNLLVIKSEDKVSDIPPQTEFIENKKFLTSKPNTINSLTITNIKEYYIIFNSPNKSTYYEEKYAKLFEIMNISKGKFKQALIFYNHKGRGEELSADFRSLGYPTTFINGDLNSEQRILIHNNIRNLLVKVIISTDLFSRGIDLNTVDLVINFDAPFNSTEYFHRVGRTGRFGTYGVAISFFQENEMELFNEINNKESNKEKIIELKDVNFLLNDFIQINENNVFNKETIRKLEELENNKNLTSEIKLEEITNEKEVNLKKKRRRKQFEEESLISAWVETDVQLFNSEYRYYNEKNESKEENQELNIDNKLQTNQENPSILIEETCKNYKNEFCLYCNLLNYLKSNGWYDKK